MRRDFGKHGTFQDRAERAAVHTLSTQWPTLGGAKYEPRIFVISGPYLSFSGRFRWLLSASTTLCVKATLRPLPAFGVVYRGPSVARERVRETLIVLRSRSRSSQRNPDSSPMRNPAVRATTNRASSLSHAPHPGTAWPVPRLGDSWSSSAASGGRWRQQRARAPDAI